MIPKILGRVRFRERMPSLNELLDLAKETGYAHGRGPGFQGSTGQKGRWSNYSKLKKTWTSDIAKVVALHRLPQIDAAHFTYLFSELNRRRDPSNVISAAMKFIEDGMVMAGVLPQDGWNVVLGIAPFWQVREPNGILVVMSADRTLTFDEMKTLESEMEDEQRRRQLPQRPQVRQVRPGDGRDEKDHAPAREAPGSGGEGAGR